MSFPAKNSSLSVVFFMLLLTWGDGVSVQIVNKISKDTELMVQCESGDDKLGKITIPFGKSWDFEFRPHIWGNTLFFCKFSWPGEVKRFDIYDGRRDSPCTDVCEWRITREGPCTNIYSIDPDYFYCFPWE
ncbi:hypothetical protein like AT5G12060 [Hibiscus trionum]|uniref:S-protein homolog n=1 Tax=Hibiscus trionum TaxID=183268 RepID=A0A9W7MDP5_HIBTR|nr:hypothetical protein like AT5G12060 [Hibiscus trionum]